MQTISHLPTTLPLTCPTPLPLFPPFIPPSHLCAPVFVAHRRIFSTCFPSFHTWPFVASWLLLVDWVRVGVGSEMGWKEGCACMMRWMVCARGGDHDHGWSTNLIRVYSRYDFVIGEDARSLKSRGKDACVEFFKSFITGLVVWVILIPILVMFKQRSNVERTEIHTRPDHHPHSHDSKT